MINKIFYLLFKMESQRVFTPNPIQNLEDADFELNGPVKIMLKIKKCLIVLFYVDNKESLNMTEVWEKVGRQSVSNVFAACNLKLNPKVASAFNDLNSQNSSLHWAALKTVPFILVYQNGFPVAFYNGERAVAPILDYSLTLACRADYQEFANLFGGIETDDDLGIQGNQIYGEQASPLRKDSLQYKSGAPIRTYPSSDTPAEPSQATSQGQLGQFDQLGQSGQEEVVPPSLTRVSPRAISQNNPENI